jgi:hypothetical protein
MAAFDCRYENFGIPEVAAQFSVLVTRGMIYESHLTIFEIPLAGSPNPVPFTK